MWEKENFYQATCFLSTDSSVTEFWEWCRNQLRAFYNTMCQVKITPWDPDNTVHINSIYIQVTFLQDHRKPDGTTEKKLRDISEVFEGDEHHPIRRRILVYGRPGIGKSTFTQKVAVDWANGRKKILEKFNLLLLIRLRDVCGISDLCTMLKTAELLSADDPMAVNNLCEYVRQNQEKVLLILDGYDEYSGGKSSLIHQIWRGSQLRDCFVMITTLPVKEDELRVPSHAQFKLNGFVSLNEKKQFARMILPDEEDVKGLLEYLRKYELEEMAEIPLLLLMLCLQWKEKKHQSPTFRAEFYVGFIQTFLDHMAAKDSDNVATDESIDKYQEELSKIGKLAFDALLEDCLHFNFSKFPKGDLFEKLIHVGFFQVSKLSALNREKIVYFLHKSVQEFLAAWFIIQEVKVKKNETVTCLSGMDTFEKSRKMAEVLRFVCELSSEAAGIVFDHLHYVGEKEGLTNYNFTRTSSLEDLPRAQNLTGLELWNTNMGEDEASALSRALKDVPELSILSLGSNPLGRGVGVRDLVQYLRSVPKLMFLYLEGVQMTKTELEELWNTANERDIDVFTDYHVSAFLLFHSVVSNFYLNSLQKSTFYCFQQVALDTIHLSCLHGKECRHQEPSLFSSFTISIL